MQEFTIAPAGMKPMWVILPVGLLLLVLLAFLASSALAARTTRFEVSGDGLRIRGDIYGRLVPRADLRVDEARRVDLSTATELRPKWRTMGTGLPGHQSGWFRLRNGEKSLLFVTDWTRAVYVPTSAGFSVLLSPRDPDAFLTALRQVR